MKMSQEELYGAADQKPNPLILIRALVAAGFGDYTLSRKGPLFKILNMD